MFSKQKQNLATRKTFFYHQLKVKLNLIEVFSKMPKGQMLGPRVGNSSSFNGNSGSHQSGSLDYGCCRSCHLLLRDPFIRCQVCSVNKSDEPVYICLQCFSKGLLLINTFEGLLEGNFKVNKTETPMLE
jgi:hypothetical protein